MARSVLLTIRALSQYDIASGKTVFYNQKNIKNAAEMTKNAYSVYKISVTSGNQKQTIVTKTFALKNVHLH